MKRALELEADNPENWSNLGYAHALSGNRAEAQKATVPTRPGQPFWSFTSRRTRKWIASAPIRALLNACAASGCRSERHYFPPPTGAAPRPRAGAGGSVPPSARIFMFASAAVNCVSRRARSASRAASSASIELSKNRV